MPDVRLPLSATGGVLAVAGVVLTIVRPWRRPVTRLVRAAPADARAVRAAVPGARAVGRGARVPLLQCAGAALGLGLPWAQVALGYLAAGTAVGTVPGPGGLAVDAAVVRTPVAFGAPRQRPRPP
ncbi:hypothetical protein NX794_05545 [Streptomyces sp. LP11]|uniref:Integral membrane protein n=1 Tax=Streptomyces pyxinicus TaxID=2970331 RepID=A0ABT2AWR3_9ACTN|nr:hypothetical protein [Streptomyces sp. LP11]MCS0600697.1 hypothetical protein [Streptomyces sp. LP11]